MNTVSNIYYNVVASTNFSKIVLHYDNASTHCVSFHYFFTTSTRVLDHVPDWQPRVLLGMVEARSVNVKKTTTTTRVLELIPRYL